MAISAKDILNLDPILDRFDKIEARLSAIEAAQARLSEARETPSADLASLQQHIEKEVAHIKKHIPVMLDALVAPQMDRLRDRLQTETKKSVNAALESFETRLEMKFSSRISSIEKALIDQSGIITTLSERAIESDSNLQRLIGAVEKLCERTEGRVPAAAERPFETQLTDAMKRQPEAPARPASGFRPQIVKEDEAPSQRHRRPLSRL